MKGWLGDEDEEDDPAEAWPEEDPAAELFGEEPFEAAAAAAAGLGMLLEELPLLLLLLLMLLGLLLLPMLSLEPRIEESPTLWMPLSEN